MIEREGDGYVSFRPELGIASQGENVEEATANLKEAIELFFELHQERKSARLHEEVFVTRLKIFIG